MSQSQWLYVVLQDTSATQGQWRQKARTWREMSSASRPGRQLTDKLLQREGLGGRAAGGQEWLQARVGANHERGCWIMEAAGGMQRRTEIRVMMYLGQGFVELFVVAEARDPTQDPTAPFWSQQNPCGDVEVCAGVPRWGRCRGTNRPSAGALPQSRSPACVLVFFQILWCATLCPFAQRLH